LDVDKANDSDEEIIYLLERNYKEYNIMPPRHEEVLVGIFVEYTEQNRTEQKEN
jgi:hypothetical protein